MVKINTINIHPPLINSSCAWSSDLEQLRALYESPYTGAVTTRTATLDGFQENESHTVAFASSNVSSINSYGYSPHPLDRYLSWIAAILVTFPDLPRKPFLISITSSDPVTLRTMMQAVQSFRAKLKDNLEHATIAIELNTSCPNIPGAPPTGYTFPSLMPLLLVLKEEYAKDQTLTIGLKLPPFVYRGQFLTVLDGIKELCFSAPGDDISGAKRCPIAFFTCTNTLGNALLFTEQSNNASSPGDHFAVPTALGGLAGDALHALSLGNVYTFVELLKEADNDCLKAITVIGVGGVTSKEAAARMRRAGASVVGSATLLGKEGVAAFKNLADG